MSDLEERRQFDDRARARVISELEAVAWGDVESTTDALERALELALQATPDDFLRWETEGRYSVSTMSSGCRRTTSGSFLRRGRLAVGGRGPCRAQAPWAALGIMKLLER